MLLSAALGMQRMDLYLYFDRPLVEEELERMRQWIKRAATHEPVEYILPSVSFYHTELALSPAVLIPRQETEILVDKICKQFSSQDLEGKQVWDICTGSGCMGIALKKRFPGAYVVLADLSTAALEVATANAARNQVDVESVCSDLLSALKGRKADIVVSNPPYISSKEYEALSPSVRLFEPAIALVAGDKGLDYYERLKRDLPEHLNHQAKIFLEIGAGQGSDLLALFSEPHWVKRTIEKDWAGHDRFFFLEFE
jgi:release factor glutamine methyltransferase